MYLKNQQPLPVNSSPFFLCPKQQFKTANDHYRFTAKVIWFLLKFKIKIDRDEIPQEYSGGQPGKGHPLCMETYKNFFKAYRQPGPDIDIQQLEGGHDIGDGWNHFVVACKNHLFVVRVHKAQVTHEEQIFEQLRLVAHMAKEREPAVPIGILTTEDRGVWAKSYKKLVQNQTNLAALRYIKTSLFVVCLDEGVASRPSHQLKRRMSMAKDNLAPAFHILHGCGTECNSANRWYDKFLQVITSRDGVWGVLVEHSASEGITVLRFLEDLMVHLGQEQGEEQDRPEELPAPVALKWELSQELVTTAIPEAAKKMNKLCDDVDLYILKFNGYGKEFIKSQKSSPDAFVQLALQLTYYKVHRRMVSTYESASLRRFHQGRIDNIRAATTETLTWVRALCDEGEFTDEDKIKMFQEALRKHTEIMSYTLAGYGTDNHLLGLLEISRSLGRPDPSLFRDKSYREYLNYRLSTSQLSTNHDILVGYGAVVPDGYGCSYNICGDSITFCIASFYSSEETSSDFFACSLEGSLLQMRELCIKRSEESANKETRTA